MKVIPLKIAKAHAASHGLSERWLQLRKDIFTSSRQVDADALDTAVYSSSKKPLVIKPLAREWNDNTARTLTKCVVRSKSHSLWGKHFLSTRQSSRVSIKTLNDLLSLQPRSAFFTDYLHELQTSLSRGTFSTLHATLQKNEQNVRRFLKQQLATASRQHILNKDFEDLFLRMQDFVNMGQSLEAAFRAALEHARPNDYTDEGSSKEVPLHFPENISIVTPSVEEMVASKETLQRIDTLYAAIRAYYRKVNANSERSKLAIAIFEQAIQGATDNEIILRLHLSYTRQRVQQIRSTVMDIARRVFQSAL